MRRWNSVLARCSIFKKYSAQRRLGEHGGVGGPDSSHPTDTTISENDLGTSRTDSPQLVGARRHMQEGRRAEDSFRKQTPGVTRGDGLHTGHFSPGDAHQGISLMSGFENQ